MNYKELLRRKAEQEANQVPSAGTEAEAILNQESHTEHKHKFKELLEKTVVLENPTFMYVEEQPKQPTQTKEQTMEATIAQIGYPGISPLDEVIANSVNDLRAEVGETKATIKDSIHQQSLANGMEFCGINKSILNASSVTQQQLANVERDLQNRIHEGMRQTQTSAADLSRYLSDKGDSIKDKLASFVASTAENFCTVRSEIRDNTLRVLDRLSSDILDSKNQRINELLNAASCSKSDYQFGLQSQRMNYFEQTLGDSIKQHQAFTSKTVQFGTGNSSGTAQTANQG